MKDFNSNGRGGKLENRQTEIHIDEGGPRLNNFDTAVGWWSVGRGVHDLGSFDIRLENGRITRAQRK